MTNKPPFRIALAAVAVFVVVLVPTATAGKPGGGHGGGGSCTRNTPSAAADNTWAWASPGSWGMPGQQLKYEIQVTNNDVGCASSSFVISMSAPSGFSVSMPTNTISVRSSSSAYLYAYVTSPNPIADGDYPLTVTIQRAGSSSTASSESYYKVYSSDNTLPTLFLSNPGEGQTISGSSYNVVVFSSDDHAVQRIEIYIDNNLMSTNYCDNLSYSCHAAYNWSIRGASGPHTATFKSYDWMMKDPGVLNVSFTVS